MFAQAFTLLTLGSLPQAAEGARPGFVFKRRSRRWGRRQRRPRAAVGERGLGAAGIRTRGQSGRFAPSPTPEHFRPRLQPIPIPGSLAMSTMQFGERIARNADPALLRGEGSFIDDIDLPGALHGAFVRSAVARAKIRSVDTGAAEALDGVVTVYTCDNIGDLDVELPLLIPHPDLTHPKTQRPAGARRRSLRRSVHRHGDRRRSLCCRGRGAADRGRL